jgi:NAD(P)-dependent dehydrogenase (short-subunit alcohol dehydrogenase family)
MFPTKLSVLRSRRLPVPSFGKSFAQNNSNAGRALAQDSRTFSTTRSVLPRRRRPKSAIPEVSGAASGIGLTTAQLLASKGARLSLGDVQKPLQALAREPEKAGHEALTAIVDVSNRVVVEDWIRKTVDKFGKLGGTVNCAGIGGKGMLIKGIQDIDDDDWGWVFNVNVKGALNCLRAQIPNINEAASVVVVASLSGLMGNLKNAAYVASKHAAVGLCRVAAKKMEERGIQG